MDELFKQWEKEYDLKDLRLIGYAGGYPMIQFNKEDKMEILQKSEKDIKKVIRQAEMNGGFELGVGINFRKTSNVIINNETIVIYGHEVVLKRILNKLF